MDAAMRKRTNSHGSLPRSTHLSPLARELNIDALRLTPLDPTDPDPDGSAGSSTSSPSLSRSASASSRRRRRPSGLSVSNPDSPNTTPATSPLLGSYKHSLLSGRMAASPPSTFTLTLSVNSLPPFRNFFVPPKLEMSFEAHFYEMNGPWVGTIDLDEAPELKTKMFETEGGFRVPPKGQVQLVIKNQLGTMIKVLLVPYDLKDMPAGSQAPMRRLWYGEANQEHLVDPQPHSDKDKEKNDKGKDVALKEVLRYAVHLKFVCPLLRPTLQPRPRAHSAGHPAAHRGAFSKLAMTTITSANVEHETVDSDEGDLSSHSGGEGSSLSRGTSSPRKKVVRSSSMDSRKIFLAGEIRVVFAPRVPDEEEMVRAESEEGDMRDRYFTYDGPPPLDESH